jgi:ubiquinol-cytochrome c reductase cytochrome b subunit
MRSPDGAYTERHLPISDEEAFVLASREPDPVLVPAGEIDENGLRAPGTRVERAKVRLSRAVYGDQVQPPTPEQIAESRQHAAHERGLEARRDGDADR